MPYMEALDLVGNIAALALVGLVAILIVDILRNRK